MGSCRARAGQVAAVLQESRPITSIATSQYVGKSVPELWDKFTERPTAKHQSAHCTKLSAATAVSCQLVIPCAVRFANPLISLLCCADSSKYHQDVSCMRHNNCGHKTPLHHFCSVVSRRQRAERSRVSCHCSGQAVHGAAFRKTLWLCAVSLFAKLQSAVPF